MTDIDSETWYDAGRSFLVIAVVIALAMSTMGVAAGTPPSPPNQVYGTVTDSGSPASGMMVQATHDGQLLDESATESDGSYTLEISAENVSSGDTITISVAGTDASETIQFQSGNSDRIDFTVSGGEDPPTTTEPGDPGDEPTTTTTPDGDDGGPTGGTGGGGGGGADEPTTTSTPPTTGASGTAQIDANGSATVELPDAASVEGVSVSSPGSSGDVTVTELSAPPEGVSEPSGSRVAMVDISAPNPSEGSATVSLSVRQSALPDGVSASELDITHYTDGAWQDLDTSVASSDGPVVLEAQVSSFSPFAVTAQDQATTTTQPTTTPETTGPTDTETTAPTDDGEGGGGFPVIPVVVVVVLVAALGGVWLYTQRE